jgi:hypothetical protein
MLKSGPGPVPHVSPRGGTRGLFGAAVREEGPEVLPDYARGPHCRGGWNSTTLGGSQGRNTGATLAVAHSSPLGWTFHPPEAGLLVPWGGTSSPPEVGWENVDICLIYWARKLRVYTKQHVHHAAVTPSSGPVGCVCMPIPRCWQCSGWDSKALFTLPVECLPWQV